MSEPSKQIRKSHQPCPVCPSSDGYTEWADGHGWCFVCEHRKPADKEQEEERELDTGVYTYEFVPHRGLHRETLKHYGIKTKIDEAGKPVSVGFPYDNGAYKIRSLDQKEFWSKGEISKAGLFGRELFSAGSHKFVTITEGEYDAASYWQVLRSPVVSVHSSSSAVRDCVRDREWLQSFDRIYLAFDSDGPGQKAAREVARLFDVNKVFHVKFDKYKDANDYLQHGEDVELRNIWANARKYLPEGITSSSADFLAILKNKPKAGVPVYPSRLLNEMTYGVRTGESVLIKAQEGVGKTELMHHIEYNILQETDDAIGAIFLEEPKRRHLQALAGLNLQSPVHLPDTVCSDSELADALRRALRQDERLHLYSHFGSDEPGVIEDTIRFMVSSLGCRYILLDHISMVVSGLQGDDERKALDYLSTRLEMMVKELDFALIFVSHVNDAGQTRGSRYISKVSDIVIEISRNVNDPDPLERNTTYLNVSKNRFSGRTGPAGHLIFDPDTYSYTDPFKINIPKPPLKEAANA